MFLPCVVSRKRPNCQFYSFFFVLTLAIIIFFVSKSSSSSLLFFAVTVNNLFFQFFFFPSRYFMFIFFSITFQTLTFECGHKQHTPIELFPSFLLRFCSQIVHERGYLNNFTMIKKKIALREQYRCDVTTNYRQKKKRI